MVEAFYWFGFALAAVGSFVIGAATVLSAFYLRRLKGDPFTQVVAADELQSAIRTHAHNKRVISCVVKMPDGFVMISGR